MGRAIRAEQFDPDQVNIVHTIQRCVRRAFLAGFDQQTGIDYGFRREWIRRRMEALASVFGVDVLTYAVMSNHMHLILRNRPDVVATWTDQQVALRWLKVFPGRRIEEHLGEPTDHEVKTLANDQERIAEIRGRLSDISWFMRALSEPIARMANRQDECTGRFWEGRFKAQTIVDEAALLACAMYVDLNPVRAALAESPAQSKHTSAFDRIKGEKGETIPSAAFDLVPVPREKAAKAIREIPVAELRKRHKDRKRSPTGKRIARDAWLAPLRMKPNATSSDPEVSKDGLKASTKGFLEIDLKDYLTLLRWVGKQRETGSGKDIPKRMQPLVSRLGIDLTMFRDLVWEFQRYFGSSCCAGSPSSMNQFAESTDRRWSRGQNAIKACFV